MSPESNLTLEEIRERLRQQRLDREKAHRRRRTAAMIAAPIAAVLVAAIIVSYVQANTAKSRVEVVRAGSCQRGQLRACREVRDNIRQACSERVLAAVDPSIRESERRKCETPAAVGDRGQRGPVGPRGVRGARGVRGPRGRTGARGAPGRNGSDGRAGERGAQGERGARGPSGSVGPPGPAPSPEQVRRAVCEAIGREPVCDLVPLLLTPRRP